MTEPERETCVAADPSRAAEAPMDALEEAEQKFAAQVNGLDTQVEQERGTRELMRRVDAMFGGVIKATKANISRAH